MLLLESVYCCSQGKAGMRRGWTKTYYCSARRRVLQLLVRCVVGSSGAARVW